MYIEKGVAFLLTSEQCLKKLDGFFSNKEDRP
jgi:hypothetical protein